VVGMRGKNHLKRKKINNNNKRKTTPRINGNENYLTVEVMHASDHSFGFSFYQSVFLTYFLFILHLKG
jgi:hypothetical protein